MTKTAAEVEQMKHAPATNGIIPAILHRWSPVPSLTVPWTRTISKLLSKPPVGPPPLTTSSPGASLWALAAPRHTRKSSRRLWI